jgi:hypothetical protein
MVTAAASAPVTVGAKWPWMVHSAPAARLVPQLLPNTNDGASPPVRAILEIVKAAVPVFVKVTDCELLDMPRPTEPYPRLVAERVTEGSTPVPLSVIVCGDVTALSTIVAAASSAPVAVGEKWPWIVQLAATARLVPQLLAKTNEEAFAPVTAMLLMVNAALPVFVRITACDALEEPTFTEPYAKLVDERVSVCADKATGKKQVKREQTKKLDTSITSAHVLAHVNVARTFQC